MSKLAHDPPEPEALPHSAQVLQFRPRARLVERADADRLSSRKLFAEPVDDHVDHLAQYEQDREEDEYVNYPHRMLMNVIAVVIVGVLIGVGVWLADTIADMEREQDCVLQGRQNCAPIEVDIPPTVR